MKKPNFFIEPHLPKESLGLTLRTDGKFPPSFQPFINKEKVALIPFNKAKNLLRELSLEGSLSFLEKNLIIDFFGEAKFHLEAFLDESKQGKVKGYFSYFEKKIEVSTVSFLFPGPPSGFIIGVTLKFVEPQIPWKLLKTLHEQGSLPFEQLDLNQELSIVYLDGCQPYLEKPKEVTPILVLNDPFGAFAHLEMNYANERISFHTTHKTTIKREEAAEKAWEKDLLETDFIKKQHGNSYYFCPLDKVYTSLKFLLEIGWTILDRKGRKILLYTGSELNIQTANQQLIIQGKLCFDKMDKEVGAVLQDFRKKERFTPLLEGFCGLLPNQWEEPEMAALAESSLIVGEKLTLPKTSFGLLEHTLKTAKDPLKLIKAFSKEAPFAPASSNFKSTLRPYQQEGLNWLAFLKKEGFCGLLADEMGLGKTVQVIAFISQLETPLPLLIVVPTSLLFHWKKEIETHLKIDPDLINIYHGKQRSWNPDAKIVITSYALLRLDLAFLETLVFSCVILDEAQTIKNASSQTFLAAKKIKSSFRLSLTGTPIENRKEELWSHFHFLIPELFGEISTFLKRPATHIKALIRPFLLKRKKEEVAKELPPKISEVIWVEMDILQKEAYDTFLHSLKTPLLKKVNLEGAKAHRMEILETILRLRQFCCHPNLVSYETSSAKLQTLLDDLDTISKEGGKTLIYSQFTSMLNLIGRAFKERGWAYVRLDGSTKDRKEVVETFQNDPTLPFFLISLKAGGIGLNLTAADYVCLFDPWWNEAVENQAIDRAYRIGQTKTVFAKRYITLGTIEEKMMLLKEKKEAHIKDLLESNEEDLSSSFSDDELLSLL